MAKKEENKDRFQIGQVATEHQAVIVDTEDDNKSYDVLSALILVLNKLDSMEKKIVG
jgi:hypothetical protein